MQTKCFFVVRGVCVASLLALGANAGFAAGDTVAAAATSRTAKQKLESGDVEKPAAVDADVVSVSATVANVDYQKRELTLQGDQGGNMTVQVGPDVTRFNEIKKGDRVDVDYFESVAITVQPPDAVGGGAMAGAQTAVVRNPGKKPSGMVIDTDMVTATVASVDAKNRTAELTGPNGGNIHVEIAPDVPDIDKLKKGDQVKVRYTRTLAIAVRKPGQ